jgi:hypothetical protein
MNDPESDRAASLRIAREIPEGDYNREIVIKATDDGLVIDDYIVISWEWIQHASAQLREDNVDTDYSKTRSPRNSES